MKENKANAINNNAIEIDSFGLTQVADYSLIDEESSSMLDKELLNDSC